MAIGKKISRRSFIKGVTCAVGFPYIVPSSVFGKAGAVAPSNRVTMGFIGVGSQGSRDLTGFLGNNGVQVVAVCDVDKGTATYRSGRTYGREPARRRIEDYYAKQRLSGSYKGCDVYGDYRDLIKRDDIDAVLIATPDHWHAIIAIAAARAGKDIFCQKPLAYTIAEGRAICDAVDKYGVVWQTGSQQRSDTRFHRVCELVRNGRIGKVSSVTVGLPCGNGNYWNPSKEICPVPDGFDYDMWLGPAPWAPYSPGRCHGNWRWVSDYSGGQITDWAGHHIDIAQWAMGTELTGPVEIVGSGKFPTGEGVLYDTVEEYRFECRYAEGFKLIVTDSRRYPKYKDGVRLSPGYIDGLGILFEGTEGWIHINRNGLDARPGGVLDCVIAPEEIRLYKSDDHRANFVNCIKSRGRTAAPAEIGQRSISVGHLGLAAIKLGRKLRWDPLNEQFINDSQADRLLSRPMRSPWRL